MVAMAAHGDVRPLLARGRLVTVDGHPVCAACGAAVVPASPPSWQHVPGRRGFPRRSAWFAPVTWPRLRHLRTYSDFVARYPWTTRPELCGGVITSEADWREGVRRLRQYHARLAVVRRRRVLRPGENPYRELAGVLAGVTGDPILSWSLPGGLGNVLNLPARRRELAALFSWAIPDEGPLSVLDRYGPLVESGAGTGYWAALLRARGTDIDACDAAPPGSGPADNKHGENKHGENEYHDGGHRPWTQVRAANAVAAVRAGRGKTLFLCWPPFDDDGACYAALRAYRGDVLLYLGEAAGGPTGTVRFHRELELNWSPAEQVAVPNWPGLRDRLVVYVRNQVRRPLTRRDRCAGCRRFMPTGSAGRCDDCFARHPPAMALRVNGHRVEYPREVVDAMPAGLRLAFERSPSLIRADRDGRRRRGRVSQRAGDPDVPAAGPRANAQPGGRAPAGKQQPVTAAEIEADGDARG
jgi:hypothetical protein